MSETITDANDCVINIGSGSDGLTTGRLIVSSFDLEKNKNQTRKFGIGNETAQARTSGNTEIDLSFTVEGKNDELIGELESGNFTVTLSADETDFVLPNVDGSYSVSVDDEEFTLDFDGHSLGYRTSAEDG